MREPQEHDDSASPEGAACRRRPYRLGRRQAAVDETRERILDAARSVIMGEEVLKGFSIDAVARRAGVARMTVYHRFESKAGLLEALLNQVGSRGGMEGLASASGEADPLVALARFLETFARLWASDRLVIRRLRALGALDADFGRGLRERDTWRRGGARHLVRRLASSGRIGPAASPEEAERAIFVLSSFETFDALADELSDVTDLADRLRRLALAALDLPSGPVR